MTGLRFLIQTPDAARSFDGGLLAVVAALLFAAVLAHRYWRKAIRLEDELATTKKDLTFHYGRYRRAWRTTRQRAALVERVTGFVTEATPGWEEGGLPAKGSAIHRGDEAAQEAWSAIPAPGSDGSVGAPFTFHLGGRAFKATPLAEESLGLVLVEPE
ncbi:MAG TPA: hypothetical protein VL181_11750 [Holophagaceae bacterium]|nr:hypothetical protein [Holophagaceae bacterium]